MNKQTTDRVREQVPSTEQFYRALQALEESGRLTETRRKMLKFHLDHTKLTATQMANHMGHKDYGWSNLHYGKLAKLICEELVNNKIVLKYDPNLDGSDMYTSVVANIIPRTNKADVEMELKEEVAEAIRRIGI